MLHIMLFLFIITTSAVGISCIIGWIICALSQNNFGTNVIILPMKCQMSNNIEAIIRCHHASIRWGFFPQKTAIVLLDIDADGSTREIAYALAAQYQNIFILTQEELSYLIKDDAVCKSIQLILY